MRVVAVLDDMPFPADSGYRVRLAGTVAGLRRLGPLDLLCLPASAAGTSPAEDSGVEVVAVPWLPAAARLRGWPVADAPRRTVWRDWTAARPRLAELARDADLVWFGHLDVWAGLRSAVPSGVRVAVDVDNLDDVVARRRRAAVLPRLRAAPNRRAAAVDLARVGLDLVDAPRWARLRREAAAGRPAGVDVLAVCSESDAAVVRAEIPTRSSTRVIVVPNGYDRPDSGSAINVGEGGRRPDPATLTLVGSLAYEPNLDAATLLATEVLPRVRRSRPEAAVRLVGAPDPTGRRAAALAELPGVTVTGRVPDIAVELARATLCVVPMRWGGGTRIKILEAFAAGVPVVSTSLGVEGIAAVDGRDLLVTDDPGDLADAVVRLLDDPEGAEALAVSARRLWQERYRWDRIGAGLAAELTASAPAVPPGAE